MEDIVDKNGNAYSGSNSFLDKPLFILKDTTTKQIIYFKYDKESENDFPFNTSKVTYDEKVICSKIEREVDDFTGLIKLNSPFSNNYQPTSMIIHKEISKTKKKILNKRVFSDNIGWILTSLWKIIII